MANYRPFAELAELRLGPLATIIGKNDVGKSSILKALQTFLEDKPALCDRDVSSHARPSDDVVIEVAFDDLPATIALEPNVTTTLQEERLVDAQGRLRIRKICPSSSPSKYSIAIVTDDFQDDRFAGLPLLAEKDLNKRCQDLGIDVTKSGRGITNKGKRENLRVRAVQEGVATGERDLALSARDSLWKTLEDLLPGFVLFESDTRLGIEEASFQSEFRTIIKTVAQHEAVKAKEAAFSNEIKTALQSEVDKIFQNLQRHTAEFQGLTARPSFAWDKAVSFDIYGKDSHGQERSLGQRGSGMRRLLMVAFFQYLAQRDGESGNILFGIEEPENCLHPGLQRELASSLRLLADRGSQIILTSHSPVFAGCSPIDDLSLIVRKDGRAEATQTPSLNLEEVAHELGVEPADQLTGYDACVFVEGPCDIRFWKTVARKFKEAGRTTADVEDKRIGLILFGGGTLKHWMNLRLMKRLNRRFAVIVDSDRKCAGDPVPGSKSKWQQQCQADGGCFVILRKREIENYLHPDAIERSGRAIKPYDGYSDMKALFGDQVFKVIDDMSCEEILAMDRYEEGGQERHELEEIVQALLGLPAASGPASSSPSGAPDAAS